MKKLIVNPLSNIPKNKKSHSYGWSLYWSNFLNADINHNCDEFVLEYDEIYLDLGVNFNGGLNLFGGLSKDIFDRFNIIMQAHSKNISIFSLNHDMPDFGAMFKKRLHNNSTDPIFTEEWCNSVSLFCKTVCQFAPKNNFQSITIGDSHSIAYSNYEDYIIRQDGKTLYSALKQGLDTYKKHIHENIKKITFCFGSVDIRHHILRHNQDLEDLIYDYVTQTSKLQKELNIPIYLCAPVPVEYEGRRIPKSGFYKDTAFYGSQEQRAQVTDDFIFLLQCNYDYNKIVQPPEDWYTMDPEKYAKEIMELSSSVHIAPSHYKRNKWGSSNELF